MWRCRIRQVGYYMHKFITNKMKKEISFVFFSLIVMIFFFFLEGRPVSGVDFFFPGGETCFWCST